jgi:Response regulator containing CheY-like receiver domain and AraC-type DNA-binding domain
VYKVFIVDDESLIAWGLGKIIDWEGMGCRAYVYTSSTHAYESALVENPQILITDVKMPDMDGLDLIGRMRNASARFEAIVLSGYSEFEYARKGIELGVNKYILKPVDQEILKSAVLMSIDRYRAKSVGSSTEPKVLPEVHEENEDVIENIKEYITGHYTENISLTALSERFFLNPIYLSQLFRKKTGHTYIHFLTGIRIEKAKELLSDSRMNVAKVCHSVGYENVQHFSRTFGKVVGVKPSLYKKE